MLGKGEQLQGASVLFSLLAGVLSRGLVLAREGWKRFPPAARRGMLHPLTIADDGSFDCVEAMRLWRAAETSAQAG